MSGKTTASSRGTRGRDAMEMTIRSMVDTVNY
jgi:hypothetical protein